MRKTRCLIMISLIMCWACSSSIETYTPKSDAERQIISLLIRYRDAKNQFDIKRLLTLLHDRGQFSYACGQMVSKAELKERLSGLWDEIRSGNQMVIPMVHECINGDYFASGDLINPWIEVDNDSAETTVMFTKGFCRLLLHFSLSREEGLWLITRTQWGQN